MAGPTILPDLPTLLTRQQVAKVLQVSTRTVDRLVAAGTLTSVKVNGIVRIPRHSLQKLVDA